MASGLCNDGLGFHAGTCLPALKASQEGRLAGFKCSLLSREEKGISLPLSGMFSLFLNSNSSLSHMLPTHISASLSLISPLCRSLTLYCTFLPLPLLSFLKLSLPHHARALFSQNSLSLSALSQAGALSLTQLSSSCLTCLSLSSHLSLISLSHI